MKWMKMAAAMPLMAAGAIWVAGCHRGTAATEADGGAVKVSTMRVGMTDLSGSRTYSGTVQSSSQTALSFPVGGTVKTVNVAVGDRVAKGQLIASLDNESLRDAYDVALAALATAQDSYDRMKLLHDANSLTDMKWVEAQNALAAAQSSAAISRRALADANIYAPMAGYVTDKPVDAGMTVAPTVPVVKLVAINPVHVVISVPENEIASVKQQRADITVGAIGEHFTGRLVEKGVSANPLSRSYDVKFEVDNAAGTLLPGMICDVVMLSDEPQPAIVVPQSAVLLDANNQCFVWLSRGGRAAKAAVSVGGLADDGVIINGGLAEGDSIIVAGQQKVSQGQLLSNK